MLKTSRRRPSSLRQQLSNLPVVPFIHVAVDQKRTVDNYFTFRSILLTKQQASKSDNAASRQQQQQPQALSGTTNSVETSPPTDALATMNRRLLHLEAMKGFVVTDELYVEVILRNHAEGHLSHCVELLTRMGAQGRRPLPIAKLEQVLVDVSQQVIRFLPESPNSGFMQSVKKEKTREHDECLGVRGVFAMEHLFLPMWRALHELRVRTTFRSSMGAQTRASQEGAGDENDDADDEGHGISIESLATCEKRVRDFFALHERSTVELQSLLRVISHLARVGVESANSHILVECGEWLLSLFGTSAARTWAVQACGASSSSSGGETPLTLDGLKSHVMATLSLLWYGLYVSSCRHALTNIGCSQSRRGFNEEDKVCALAAMTRAVIQELLTAEDGVSEDIRMEMGDCCMFMALACGPLIIGFGSTAAFAVASQVLSAPFHGRFSGEEVEAIKAMWLNSSNVQDAWTVAQEKLHAAQQRGDTTAASSILSSIMEWYALDQRVASGEGALLTLERLLSQNITTLLTKPSLSKVGVLLSILHRVTQGEASSPEGATRGVSAPLVLSLLRLAVQQVLLHPANLPPCASDVYSTAVETLLTAMEKSWVSEDEARAMIGQITEVLEKADMITSETIWISTFQRLFATARSRGWSREAVQLREWRTLLFF